MISVISQRPLQTPLLLGEAEDAEVDPEHVRGRLQG